MRKIVVVIALILVVVSIAALPAFNPWTRHWVFEFDGRVYNFRCDGHEKCHNIDTGESYWYDWSTITDTLTIFDLEGRDWNFKVEFPDSQYSAIGYEIDLGIEFNAYVAY